MNEAALAGGGVKAMLALAATRRLLLRQMGLGRNVWKLTHFLQPHSHRMTGIRTFSPQRSPQQRLLVLQQTLVIFVLLLDLLQTLGRRRGVARVVLVLLLLKGQLVLVSHQTLHKEGRKGILLKRAAAFCQSFTGRRQHRSLLCRLAFS